MHLDRTATHGEDRFDAWYRALEERHRADLTFAEVRRAVQALSAGYVQRRDRVPNQLRSAGKRAAFALFYGPLHFLLVREIVQRLEGSGKVQHLMDLGCGTGVGGAAWALASSRPVRLEGIERNPWAAGEARWTYRTLGLRGTVRETNVEGVSLPGPGAGILAAYTVNELATGARERQLGRLLDAAGRGAAVLVIEPVARRLTPWWDAWAGAVTEAGGTTTEWRFPASLPASLRLMDKAAGLDHRELTARSLWLPGPRRRPGQSPST